MKINPEYVYKVKVETTTRNKRGELYEAVKDGDTVVGTLDHGFHLKKENVEFRLHLTDAYETSLRRGTTEEQKQLGLEAKACLQRLLPVGSTFLIESFNFEEGKYGRVIARYLIPLERMESEVTLDEVMAFSYEFNDKRYVDWGKYVIHKGWGREVDYG